LRFHLIDRVDAYERGRSVRARKLTSGAEEFWETGPNGSAVMPPWLVLEALCQAGVWLVVLSTDARLRPALLSIASAEFGGPVSPGDVLDIEGWVESFDDESAVLSGRVSVDGATVLEARDIMCVLQPAERLEELEQTRRMEALLIRASAPA
jgi:3-hydroxyacyl-[acyl-carrier-protein] dehydratase